METPHWPSVWMMTGINVVLVGVIILAVFFVVRWVVRRVMAEAVKAVSKRLDASEIYLTAAEQHTALQQDWEVKRQGEHARRQKEYIQMNRQIIKQIIQEELKDKLGAATREVVGKVEKVPAETAVLVAEEAVKVAATKLTSDSHDGSTPAPQYRPPAGGV